MMMSQLNIRKHSSHQRLSSRRSDINALKARLEHANINVKDANVFNEYMEAMQKITQGKKRR